MAGVKACMAKEDLAIAIHHREIIVPRVSGYERYDKGCSGATWFQLWGDGDGMTMAAEDGGRRFPPNGA